MKRRVSLTALALCLFLSVQCCAFVLPLEGDVLASEEGALLTGVGEYQSIEPLPGGQYAGYKEEGVFLLDGSGIVVGGPYEALFEQDGKLLIMEGGLLGVLGELPCTHTQIAANGAGGYLAINSDPYDDKPDGVYHIDASGSERATGIRIQYGLCSFSEGLMPVVDAVSGRMGYLNREGEWGITPQFEYAGDFRDGVAEAALVTGTGLIDGKGNWLLTPKYEALGRSGDGHMVLAQENRSSIVLLDGKDLATVKTFTGLDICFFADSEATVAVLYLDDCTRLIGAGGQTLVESGLDAVFDLWSETKDRMLVRLGDWGEPCVWLYDMDGRAVAGPWQDAWLLGEGLYAVSEFEVYESVDTENAWHSYEMVEGSEKISVVNAEGETVIPGRPLISLTMDKDGYLIMESEEGAGAMDRSGKLLCWYSRAGEAIPPQNDGEE